jgi:putative nucleotidyltransferase with HDIG domain
MKSILKRFFKESDISKKFNSIEMQLLICSIILFAVLHISYSMTIFEYPYDYKENEIVDEAVVLKSDYFDESATEILKDNVKYSIDEIYTIDPKVYADAKESVGLFYNEAYDIRAEYDEEDIRLRVFSYMLRETFELSEEELIFLSSLDDVELRLSENYVYDVLKATLETEVTNENIISKKQLAMRYFDSVDQLSDEIKPIIIKIVVYHINTNSNIDELATEALIKENQELIKDVIIPSGTVLVEVGQPLDKKSYNIINELGLNDLHTFEQNIPLLSMDVLVILIIGMMYFVIRFFSIKRKKSNKMVYLNHLIMILTYLLAFGLKDISIFLLPLATVGMLISVLDDFASGIIYSFFVTLLFGVIYSLPATVIATTILGAVIASILVHRMHQRSKIFISGLVVSLVNAVMILSYVFINQHIITDGLELVMYGLLSGIICSIITIGSLPLWEVLFNILTPLKLLELSNPNHPLMKRMLREAPGTYHHSIMVANLSEAAVHDINGNAILARVGAYFHDVGKIDRPYFFVENQFEKNPHDSLVPLVSAKVIKDHIVKGRELGKTYKLPKEIIAFVEEHHGTTLIRYFYHKACENNDSELEIDPLGYAYDGPVPQSKETAVVMLADSVEAAVRSMKQGDVKTLISKIIDDKIKSHQLDESGLTFGDIKVIKHSFYSNLSSAFHERIEYPEMEERHINIIK